MIVIYTFFLFFYWISDGATVYAQCNHAANIEMFSKPTGGKPLVTIPCGSLLVVLDSDQQWEIVKTLDGTVGYVNVQSLSKDNPRPPEQTVMVPSQVKVTEQGSVGALTGVLSVPSNGVGYGSGGGVFQVGGGVSPPRIKYQTEPEFSEEARKSGREGTVVVRATVGQDGKIHDPHVVRSLGLGLDEKAIEAVNQWLFEPAVKDGHKVAVYVDIEVNFHLYHREASFTKDELSEYPLRVLIIDTHWQNSPDGGGVGYGHGDLHVAGSWVGFDYTFSCESQFKATEGEAHPAKWEIPSTRMLLLTEEIANPRQHHQCELKTTLRDFEYASAAGRTVIYRRDQSGKLKVDEIAPELRPTPRLEARSTLSNADVISMVGAGLSMGVIVAKMNASECHFDTSPEALRQLKAAHVPENIMLEMIKR